jgi:hypothetical protein
LIDDIFLNNSPSPLPDSLVYERVESVRAPRKPGVSRQHLGILDRRAGCDFFFHQQHRLPSFCGNSANAPWSCVQRVPRTRISRVRQWQTGFGSAAKSAASATPSPVPEPSVLITYRHFRDWHEAAVSSPDVGFGPDIDQIMSAN